MVVTLGALIADVAHTLPVPITGLASDEELVERLDLQRSNYEGPTGVVGVLHDACDRRGIPSASLWAAVPHYVAAVPNPKAALALLRRLEGLVGVAVEASGLEEESESLRAPGLERGLRQSRDPGAGAAAGGRAGRAARDRRRPSLGRGPRRGLRALPAPAGRPRARLQRPASRRLGSGLRGRADQPEVAPGADLGRRAGLEVLAEDPLARPPAPSPRPARGRRASRRPRPSRRRARTSSCRRRVSSFHASRAASR